MGFLTSQHVEFSGNSVGSSDVSYAALNGSCEKIVVVISSRQYDGSTSPNIASAVFDQGGNDEGLTFITGARAYETIAGDRHMGAEVWYLDTPTDLSAGTFRITWDATISSVEGVLSIYEFDDEGESGASGGIGVYNGSGNPSDSISTRDGNSVVVAGAYWQIYDAAPISAAGILGEDYDGGQNVTGCGWAGHGTGTGGSDTVGCTPTTTRRVGFAAYEVLISSANAIPTIVLDTADSSEFHTGEPELLFTGSDTESDDLRYNVLVSDDENFGSGVTLADSHTTGI